MKTYDEVIEQIEEKLSEKSTIIVGIEGPAAAGKSTLAQALKKHFDGLVIRIDDFFLMDFQRTKERLLEPGGNFDRERFISEVKIPLENKENIIYRPYNCATKSIESETQIKQKKVTIIEGVYSAHPELDSLYDIKIFVDVDKKTQLARLFERNPEKYKRFIEEWLPLEELYFSTFKIAEKCDIKLQKK